MKIRILGTATATVAAACLSMAGATATATPAASPASTTAPTAAPKVGIRITWPRAPYAGKRITVRGRAAVANGRRVQVQYYDTVEGWTLLAGTRVHNRAYRVRTTMPYNRMRLRVAVLPTHTKPQLTSRAVLSRLPRVSGTRTYGEGPVEAQWAGQVLALKFDGSRGDVVSAAAPALSMDHRCSTMKLRNPRGKVMAQQRTYQPFRLGMSGTWTWIWTPCLNTTAVDTLSLSKVKTVNAKVDGPAVRAPKPATGFNPGIDVDVTTGARVVLRAAEDYSEQFRFHVGPGAGWGEFVLPGVITLGKDSMFTGAGRHTMVAIRDARVQASAPRRVSGSINNEVALTTGNVWGREQEVEFFGRAGQWLHPAITASADWGQSTVSLVGPDGDLVAPRRTAGQQFGSADGRLFHLTENGTYRLRVLPQLSRRRATATLTIRSVTELAPITAPDTVEFSTSEPGHMVVAPLAQGNWKVSVTDSTWPIDTGQWRLVGDEDTAPPTCATAVPIHCDMAMELPFMGEVSSTIDLEQAGYLVLVPGADQTGRVTVDIDRAPLQ